MVEFSIKPPSPSVNNKSNRLSSKRLGEAYSIRIDEPADE